MQTELRAELRAVRDLARELARAEVAPRAAEIDERAIFPWDVFRTFADAGLLGLNIPEAYGGSGLGAVGLALAIEQVAMHCANSAAILVMADLVATPLLLGGSEAQKKKYLSGIATGDLRGALCMTEAHGGSDLAAIRTRAELRGGHYRLEGAKAFISGAEEADFLIVLARTDPNPEARGFSLFLVEAENPGVAVGKTEVKLGVRGLPVYAIDFDECSVPYTARIGEEGDGWRLIMESMNRTRPVLAARGLGLAEGALMHWVRYARERESFGQPIARHQGLQWMAADLAAQVEAVRALVFQAAAMVDAGRHGPEHAPVLAAAKLLASELAVKAGNDCMQMAGAVGYMESYPFARFLRDARQLTIVEGTSQIQQNIIGKALTEGRLAYG